MEEGLVYNAGTDGNTIAPAWDTKTYSGDE